MPQGSVLGPSLFSVLVGDLLSSFSDTDVLVQYADEANVVIPFHTTDSRLVNDAIRDRLTGVERWCSENGQVLNVKKTKLLLIRRNLC